MIHNDKQQIYIVISQTGTILSRILKAITGAEYNHVSLCMNENLESMYSFGRRYAYFPFYGGFVVESINHGTFRRFKNTEAIILSINVDSDIKLQMTEFVNEMIDNRKFYHYNYAGLFLAAVHIVKKKHNRYYCSEFVRDFLQKFNIEGAEDMSPIVQPIHFLNIPYTDIIYKGRLQDYRMRTDL